MTRIITMLVLCQIGSAVAAGKEYEWHVSTDKPADWLVDALERSPALAKCRSIASDLNGNTRDISDWAPTPAVRELFGKIQKNPRVWEPDQQADADKWLSEAWGHVRRYQTASAKPLELNHAWKGRVYRGEITLPHVSHCYSLRTALLLELWRKGHSPDTLINTL